MVRRGCVLLAALVALVAHAATAGAAGWVPVDSLADAAQGLRISSVAVDGNNDLWLVGLDRVSNQLLIYERPPGGQITQAKEFDTTIAALPPEIAAGANGTVAVAWIDELDHEVRTLVLDPGRDWVETDLPGSSSASSAHVSVADDGTTLVSWVGGSPANVFVALHNPASPGFTGATSPPGTGGSTATPGSDAVLALPGSNGRLLWTDVEPTPHPTHRVMEADLVSGAGLLTRDPVATAVDDTAGITHNFTADLVRTDAAGDTLLGWEATVDDTTNGTSVAVQESVRAGDSGDFPPANTLDTGAQQGDGRFPALHAAFDPDRSVTFLYSVADGMGRDLFTGSAAPEAWAPTPHTLVAAGGSVFDEALATLPSGGHVALVVAGSDTGAATAIPLVAAPGAAAAFQAVAPPFPGDQSTSAPRIATDGLGDAYATAVNATTQGATTTDVNDVMAYDATPPTISAITGATTAAAGVPIAFSVSAADTISPVSVTWSFGDGATAAGGSASHAWAAGGTYTVTATATDAAGNTTSTSTSTRITVVTLPAPSITHAKLTHTTFAVASTTTATTARVAKAKPKKRKPATPRGTSIHFTLSEAGAVTATISHHASGRRTGKTCKATKAKHLTAKQRCTATVTDGTLTRKTENAGADAIAFSGRIGHRALGKGKHSLVLRATANGRTSNPATLAFTIR